MNSILSTRIIHESIFTTKDFKKLIFLEVIWTTRLRTSKFGHFMALKDTRVFIKAKAHNENQHKISNIRLNKKWKNQFQKVFKMKF